MTTKYLSLDNIKKLLSNFFCDEIESYISRQKYTETVLNNINSTDNLNNLIEYFINRKRFLNKNISLDNIIKHINNIIDVDGYHLENIDKEYHIINPDFNKSKETSIATEFNNIQTKIIEQIKNAKYLIWIVMAWFTNEPIYNALLEKNREGINIQLILNDDDINKSNLKFETYFETYRVKPTEKKNIIHHKFCIIDLKTVITGSYNWTNKANYNKESISILSDDKNVFKFTDEFISIKKDCL
ncbi:MAG TPA: hypothetical protein DDZ99_02940 [Clostridiales bacterium]|nr:hypothetical protein [Clostridiales bacterium]